ncbi:hypothetical protein AF72_03265 [Xylella taiwanensis]|uniref:Uncharacterized protein n=1 Tax=Xylella taiwanensis TaxID=1444770 RepID=Z9JL66_9GAMM|nr:hypothetical protein AF72_03265 [Xylella taiwanensis]
MLRKIWNMKFGMGDRVYKIKLCDVTSLGLYPNDCCLQTITLFWSFAMQEAESATALMV